MCGMICDVLVPRSAHTHPNHIARPPALATMPTPHDCFACHRPAGSQNDVCGACITMTVQGTLLVGVYLMLASAFFCGGNYASQVAGRRRQWAHLRTERDSRPAVDSHATHGPPHCLVRGVRFLLHTSHAAKLQFILQSHRQHRFILLDASHGSVDGITRVVAPATNVHHHGFVGETHRLPTSFGRAVRCFDDAFVS